MAGADLLGGGDVLDAGCGTGWWLERMLDRGVKASSLHGIEVSPERVEAANRRAPGSTVRTADVRELPYEDDRFAAVTLFTVLSSLASDDDRRRALAEARRVTAPGGFVLIWEPRIPTLNRATGCISRGLVREALGTEIMIRSITLAPPIARRVGRWPKVYAGLAAVPSLRSHRLFSARV